MPTEAAAAPALDFAAFLASHAPHQTALVQRYQWQGHSLWLKRAGPAHPAWRYRALAWVSHWLQVPALQPVPNPGGVQAIATEVQRLQTLAACACPPWWRSVSRPLSCVIWAKQASPCKAWAMR